MRFAHMFMLMLVLLLAQTDAGSIDALVSWFASFLPVVLWLFIFIVIIMFLYAVLKAPLDVLRKGMASLALLVAQTTTAVASPDAYITNLAIVFWGLLGSILIFLLPLLLILLLYKSFMVLVKAK